MITTRFAPSPTGYLHLGHAYSALFAERLARESGGRFLVRIEDIDSGRCRPEFDAALLGDLGWLGLRWEEPVRRQSRHLADYAKALRRLEALGLVYPCFCTRTQIRREIAAAGHAPHPSRGGTEGPVYPGTCRRLPSSERDRRMADGHAFALRLDMEKAAARVGRLVFTDHDRGTVVAEPESFGDVVLARKDIPTSYHLAVTVDDHLQGVSLVTRGEDLFPSTHVHRLLQALLGLATPAYRHHRLLTDADDRRLAKRDRAQTLRSLREAGLSADAVRRMADFS